MRSAVAAGHLGLDETGGHVGGHAELAEFDGQGLGEALEAGLGGGVVRLAALPCADEEDRLTIRPNFSAVMCAWHALVMRKAPLRCTFITASQSDSVIEVVADDAGVVHQDRGGTQLLGDPCHGRVDLIGGRHITAHADRPAAIGRDPVGNGDTGRLVEVENGDGVAVPGQAGGGGGADAAGGAGDDGDTRGAHLLWSPSGRR